MAVGASVGAAVGTTVCVGESGMGVGGIGVGMSDVGVEAAGAVVAGGPGVFATGGATVDSQAVTNNTQTAHKPLNTSR